MANFSVITDKCIKDMLCVDACATDAIHPTVGDPRLADATQLYIDPENCINCGSCISACESGAIFDADELPEGQQHFAAINAAYYAN